MFPRFTVKSAAVRAYIALPCLSLMACVAPQGSDPSSGPETGIQIGYTPAAAPELPRSAGKAPGCWALDYEPAVTETVTQDVLVQPEQRDSNGTVTAPSVWRNETTTKIITPRKILNFETPCANMLTEEFLASLQRSLQARGHYNDAVTSTLDHKTRAAIRAYQTASGLNSAYLSLESARAFGLIEIPRDEEPEIAVSPPTQETASETQTDTDLLTDI